MIYIELISALATVIAITGVILNNHKQRECFLLWLGSNSLTLAVHLYAGLYAMSVRDAIFIYLAVDGWRRWKGKATE
jgi:nicotinamide riboside transporter PnuC